MIALQHSSQMCRHVGVEPGARISSTGEQTDVFSSALAPAASSMADIFGLRNAGSSAPALII